MQRIKESLRIQYILQDFKWTHFNQEIWILFSSSQSDPIPLQFLLPLKDIQIQKQNNEYSIYFSKKRLTKKRRKRLETLNIIKEESPIIRGIIMKNNWNNIYKTYLEKEVKTIKNLKKKKEMKGLEINVKGRINGAAKARKETTGLWGTLKPQTYLGPHSYQIYQKPIYTKWGILGLTIRNAKGE